MNYPISGTFIDEITYDIPSSNWSDEDWIKDLDNMKSVGIDTVIIIRGGFNNKCIYPSKYFPHQKDENDDFLDLILRECEKRDMKVFVGLYITNLTWNDGDYLAEIEKNELYTDEVIERYSKYKSFYGWYIPHEVGCDIFNIKKLFYSLSKMCKEKTKDKKVLISPFFYTNEDVIPKDECLSASATFKEWEKLLEESYKYIDIISFQDGSAPLEKVVDYFENVKKVADKYNISLWSNVELFDSTMRGFYPIPFDLLKTKVKLIKPYVDKFICFEFSHFLSPQSIFDSAKNLFKLYKNYYKGE